MLTAAARIRRSLLLAVVLAPALPWQTPAADPPPPPPPKPPPRPQRRRPPKPRHRHPPTHRPPPTPRLPLPPQRRRPTSRPSTSTSTGPVLPSISSRPPGACRRTPRR